jgi:hypothetical protein
MKNVALKFIVVTIAISLTQSCTDELNIASRKHDLLNVRDGLLEFADQAAYNQVRKQLEGKPVAELDSWEKSLPGFVSMRTIYGKALIEEENYYENGGSISGHSPFVTQNMEAFSFFDKPSIQLNLPPSEDVLLPALVNQFGRVKIGSSIFQYRNNSIKEIRDGDMAKIQSLNEITESSIEKNISVINIQMVDLTNERGRVAFSGNASCTGYTAGEGQRVKGYIHLYKYVTTDLWCNTPYCGQVIFLTELVTGATNQIKTLGAWRDKATAQLRIVGPITVNRQSFTLDYSLGDVQTTSISKVLYSSGWGIWGWNDTLDYHGSLTFFGRHGSNCSI